VTLADALEGGIPWRETPVYVVAQLLGAIAGTLTAHAMFQLPAVLTISACTQRPVANLSVNSWRPSPALGDLGCSRLRSNTVAFRGGRLHCRGLLVLRFDFIRQSGGHHSRGRSRILFREFALRTSPVFSWASFLERSSPRCCSAGWSRAYGPMRNESSSHDSESENS